MKALRKLVKEKRKERKEYGLSDDEKEKTRELARVKRNFARSQKMSDLSFEQRAEIITQLANYKRPKDILKFIREKYGLPIKREALYSFSRVNKEQVRLKRAELMADLDDIPLRHKKVRVVKLSRYIQMLENRQDVVSAAALIKHIRDEVGDSAQDLGNAFGKLPSTGISINIGDKNSLVGLIMSMPDGPKKRAIIAGLDELTNTLEEQKTLPVTQEE